MKTVAAHTQNELRSFLIQFNEDMREKSVMFNSIFQAMRENGLPVQFANNYEANYADPNLQNLRYVIANITDKDLPYISAVIADLEQLLARMAG